ncbi:MAG: energy-coupling factor transporter transmembrane component T [Anaerolineae bacterium]
MSESAASELPRSERGKEYVRTFLFSMRVNAPLNQLHVLTKFIGILILSVVLVRVMSEHNPDPVMAGLLLLLSLGAMYLSGVTRWLFQSYLVIIFPMFLFLLLTWLAFTPFLGNYTYLRWPLYSGQITLGISLAGVIFIATIAIYYYFTKRVTISLLIGLILAWLTSRFSPNPSLSLATYPLWQPYDFIVSDQNLLIAVTKVLGYAAMVFATLLLVMTTRDIELTAALRQLHTPYLVRFFLSIVFRTLSLSLLDFETIRQAQIARGIGMRRLNLLTTLQNMAYMSVPLVATMLRRSTEIGDALQARGFSLAKPAQEFLEIHPFRAIDAIVLSLLILLAVAVLGFSFNLSQWL